MSTFITNSSEKSLKKRLTTIIELSEELKFLVGFFYFSGIEEFYIPIKDLEEKNSLKKGHIKILVGLNVDKSIHGIYEYAKTSKLFSVERVKKEFFYSIKKALTSKEIDNENFYEQAKFFIKLLEEEKLIIKKTKEPNHAKLYLFKLNNNLHKVIPSLFITGRKLTKRCEANNSLFY